MRTSPLMFVSMIVCSSSSVDSTNGSRPSARPALLTRMSTPPSSLERTFDERRATRAIGDVELERDVGVDRVDAARAACDANACLAQRLTVASPIPLDAPVTIALLPLRSTPPRVET